MSELRNKVKKAIVEGLEDQFDKIYWWDEADQELLDGGEITVSTFVEGDAKEEFDLADKFDMDVIADAAISAMESADHNRVYELLFRKFIRSLMECGTMVELDLEGSGRFSDHEIEKIHIITNKVKLELLHEARDRKP